MRSATSITTWSPPISIHTTRPSAASTPAGKWCRPGPAPQSSTSRGCHGSHPTAPSANMPRKYGTCRCARQQPCRSRKPSAGRRANPNGRNSITADVIEFGEIAAILHPRHCEERKRRSNPFLRLLRDGLLQQSLSSGGHSPDPLARNDGICGGCVAPLKIEETSMLTKTPHLFDDATRVTAGDSCWQGKTSPDYWAFVGPFGGC